MKKLFTIIFLGIIITISAQTYDFGQSKAWAEMSDENYVQLKDISGIQQFDFSEIWNDENYLTIGFIGNDFQRLDIKYISIKKDSENPELYHIKGKSKVKNNICDFQGTIKLVKHYQQTENTDYAYKNEGYILANYDFFEDKNQKHSGHFKGVLKTFYAINQNGKLIYPDDGDEPDSNYNNGFVGIWTDYKTKKSKPANWGSDFVPLSGDLNVATAVGDFIPNEKYHKNGWKYHAKGWKFPTPENWWK